MGKFLLSTIFTMQCLQVILSSEGPFTYGGHVVKAHVGRWSEEAPEHSGVIVCSMGDVPLVSLRVLRREDMVQQ